MSAWRATVLTLFPEMFPGPLGFSLAGRALERGAWSLEAVSLRDFAADAHRSVDDTPFGGGAGMVMRPDVLARAIDAVTAGEGQAEAGTRRPRICLTPRGRPLTQRRVAELAEGPGVVILCGRFEGIDERVIEGRGLEEIAVGDVVLSGGEPAAILLLDACVRLLPGVMGAAESGVEESHANSLLEYPHYTRPAEWQGRAVPPVLLSGHHAEVARWRQAEAERITRERRPDLWAKHTQDAAGAGAMDGRPAAA